VQRHLRRMVGDTMRDRLRQQVSQVTTAVPVEVAAEFYASAALGLLVWWIDHDFCHDDCWLTGRYRQLAALEHPTRPR
jgi:hypothetical protein